MDEGERLDYTLRVNGSERQVTGAWYFDSLLNVLREQLGLTGTKYACDSGQCGACTVWLDGQAANSCIVLAADAVDEEITTIEGYDAQHPEPSTLEEGLLRGGDIQCGYCMPGIVMTATAFLAENPSPTREEIKAALAGNLCRCTGYSQIIAAVEAAAAEMAR